MGRPETPQGDTQAGLTMGVLEWYDHLMVDLRDPRVDNWLGMASIWPTIIICTAYVYFVKVVGPRLMKDREPYELKNILLVYNFSQVLFSFWMFMEGWGFYISGNYSWHCEPVDYSESPVARRALNLAWWYYFSKFVLVFFHALQPLIFTCDYPVAASLMFAVTGVQYFILFMAFYRQAYSKKKSIVKVDKNGNSDQLSQTGNGGLANGHTTVLPANGVPDLRQRKLA